MALREFEQVRERIALRVEVRTIIQSALAVLGLIVAAFAAGYLLGREAVPPVAPVQTPVLAGAAPVLAGAAPMPRAAEVPLSAAPPAPILPQRMPPAPPVADQVNAALTHDVVSGSAPDAGGTGTSQAAKAAPVALAELIPVPVPVPAAAPVQAAAPDPMPTPARLPTPPAAAPTMEAVAASPLPPPPAAPRYSQADREAWVSAAEFVAAVRQAPAPWSPSPEQVHRVRELLSSAQDWLTPVAAPTVAVVAAAPARAPAPATAPAAAIVAAKPKPPTAVASRPAAPSQPATPDPNGRAAPPIAKPPQKTETPGRYVIQVKAFRSEADAEAFATELKDHGHKATVSSVAVPDKGTFFRVRLGPFPSLEAARSAQHGFETQEGHASILVLVP